MNKDEYIKKLEVHNVGLVRDASRRLELLREIHHKIEEEEMVCPICGIIACCDDCELAMELSDKE